VRGAYFGNLTVTRRKGAISRSQLNRQWPHHVALPAETLRGIGNSEAVYAFLKPLSVGPRPYRLRRGNLDFAVFCFAKPEDAQAFAERFGGEVFAAGN
jgi:hypothetical protein